MTTDPTRPVLVRALGRWSLTALVLNGIIGSGIFGLPDDVARLVGGAAPWAYGLAATGIAAIMLVFAELASQFREAGGPYLYAREAFGRFAGIQTGWFAWLVRLTSAAACANLFVDYLGEFWTGATAPLPRAVVIAALIGGLAAVNIRGVRLGAGFANFFTAAKLVPLALFIVVGLALTPHAAAPATAPAAAPAFSAWVDVLVILAYAFGGFETALMPAGETKDPRRDAPFALLTGLAVVAVFFLAIHVVAMRALPDLAHSERPLADAARAFAGRTGAALIALGAMLSTFGWLCAALVGVPRLTYALAERGDFPAVFARVHPRFRTPHVSILLWAVLVLALALWGNFLWNAILSVAARLVTYATACAALIQLRRRRPDADAWRAPAGLALAVLGFAFCGLLIVRMNADHARIVAVVAAIATANWLAVRGRAGR
jgi:amino acid transporter